MGPGNLDLCLECRFLFSFLANEGKLDFSFDSNRFAVPTSPDRISASGYVYTISGEQLSLWVL
jgi:hypothetical protein